MKMSTAEVASAPSIAPVRTPPTSISADLSLARSSKKTRSKSTESEGMLTVYLLAMGLLIWTPLL